VGIHIWLRRSLRIAALANLLAGAMFAVAPLHPLFGLPSPSHALYALFSGGLIGLFGIVYGWLARQPTIHRALLWLGAGGKATAAGVCWVLYMAGHLSPTATALISGDLLFAGFWVYWLVFTRADHAAITRPFEMLSKAAVESAPDGSQARPLATSTRASLCHCTLAPATLSQAIAHRSVEELWYFTDGEGEFHCPAINQGQPVAVSAGTSLALPSGVAFQFRNTSTDTPLQFIVATLPPWPGESEALVGVEGYWH
jgi:mannose-6-phosphate isomerase-like protein (cupin superfamily)